MGDDFVFEPEGEDYDEAEIPESRRAKRRRVNLDERLQPLRGKPKPARIVVVDIETVSWIHPYLVGMMWKRGGGLVFQHWEQDDERQDAELYIGKESKRCVRARRRKPEEEWPRMKSGGPTTAVEAFLHTYLQPEFDGTVCYAHNGGKFDFLFMLAPLLRGRRFQERGYTVDMVPLQSCLFQLTVRHPRGHKWVFRDSLRLLPMKLATLGEAMEVGKKVVLADELGCDATDVYDELAKPENRELAVRYLRQDCEVLWRSLDKFQRLMTDLGGEMKATAPSTAIALYRRRFLKGHDIYVNRHTGDCPDIGLPHPACRGCGHSFFRQAYYGGRTEVWQGEGRDLWYYDYNSHYPAQMRERMPTGKAIEGKRGVRPSAVFEGIDSGLIGIVECEVEIPADCYLPPLPVKLDAWGRVLKPGEADPAAKLVFPTGRFWSVWDTAELDLIRKVPGARILRVGRNVWFQTSVPFVEFVDALYPYRDKRSPLYSPALGAIAKLMLNSGYGKWGQREERELYHLNPPDETGMFLAFEMPYGRGVDVWRSEDADARMDHVIPQLAVHVTALARAKLWRAAMEVVEASGWDPASGLPGPLFYCDTDSLVIDVEHWPRGATKLGALKLEHHIARAWFVRPKLYRLDCADDCPCDWRTPPKGLSPSERREWKADPMLFKAKGFREMELADWMLVTGGREGEGVNSQRLSKFNEGIRAFYNDGIEMPFLINEKKTLSPNYVGKRHLLKDGVRTAPFHIVDGVAYAREGANSQRVFSGTSRERKGRVAPHQHARS
jgi:hypothetical protein